MHAVKDKPNLYLLPPPEKKSAVVALVVTLEKTEREKLEVKKSYPKVLMPTQPSGYIKAPLYEFF